MNKMSPNEQIQSELRVSSADRTGGRCAQTLSVHHRSKEEDDRLIAAIAIADLANSLPVISRSSPTHMPKKLLPSSLHDQPEKRLISTQRFAKEPQILDESAANVHTTIKRKVLTVATSANNNSSKIAKIISGENKIINNLQSPSRINNGNCRSNTNTVAHSTMSAADGCEPNNPITRICLKSQPWSSSGMVRFGLTNDQEVSVVTVKPKESCVHPSTTCDDQQSPAGYSLSLSARTHTPVTYVSNSVCIATPAASFGQPRPVASVIWPSNGKVNDVHPGQQVDTKNVVGPRSCTTPLSCPVTTTGLSTITPAMTTVHVNQSSDHEARNLKQTKKFEDIKSIPTTGIMLSHHIDAMKLPLKKRKLLETHPPSVIPIVVTPHELRVLHAARPTAVKDRQAVDGNTASLPPNKVRCVKVEQEKQGEGKKAGNPPRLARAGHNTERPDPPRTDSNDTSRLKIDPQMNFIMLRECQLAICPDEDGDLPLHIAVVQGNVEMVVKLIGMMSMMGESLDAYNKLRQTPLHLAVITKEREMARKLLEGGAISYLPDRHGNNAIHLAVKHITKECLRVLLNESKMKLDLDAKNFEGFAPLHLAVQTGDADMVSMLIEAGSDVDVIDGKSGRTPLFHAAEANLCQIASLLLQRAACVNIANYAGSTAVSAASGRGFLELVALLVKYGADAVVRDTTAFSSKERQAKLTLRETLVRNKQEQQPQLLANKMQQQQQQQQHHQQLILQHQQHFQHHRKQQELHQQQQQHQQHQQHLQQQQMQQHHQQLKQQQQLQQHVKTETQWCKPAASTALDLSKPVSSALVTNVHLVHSTVSSATSAVTCPSQSITASLTMTSSSNVSYPLDSSGAKSPVSSNERKTNFDSDTVKSAAAPSVS